MNTKSTRHVSASLRDRNKAKRRESILDSTLDLLADTSLSDLTVEQIATHAELAPATIYNLVGSRDALLTACVNRLIDDLVDHLVQIDIDADPVAAAESIVQHSCDAFIARGIAFQQIVASIGGIVRFGSGLEVDAGQLQIAAMTSAQQAGIIRPDINAAAVGRQIYLSYTGALHAWSSQQLSDVGFRCAALHGLWSAITAAASYEHHDVFFGKLQKAGDQLVAAGYGKPR